MNNYYGSSNDSGQSVYEFGADPGSVAPYYDSDAQFSGGDYIQYAGEQGTYNPYYDPLADKKHRRYAPFGLVIALLIICFPVGLITMLFFTKWGAFPKIFVTLFILASALAIYEILAANGVLGLPSLIEWLAAEWNEFVTL